MFDIEPSPDAFREALKETPVPEPTATEVAPPSGAPSQPPSPPVVETPQPSEPPPAPPDPNAARKYLKQGFGLMVGAPEVYVRGTYYHADGGNVDIEGLYGDKTFDSTTDLIRLAGFTNDQRDQFVSKMKHYLTLGQTTRLR